MSGYVIANINVKNSEEYKPIKTIRLANSVANGIIIKGV